MRRPSKLCNFVLKKWLSNSSTEGGRAGRKSFGSFHSEHIDVLLRQSKESFVVPDIVQEIKHKVVQKFPILAQSRLDLQDRDSWKGLFFTDPSWTFLNHGAFGGVMRPSLYESQLYREYCESQPLRFYDRDYFPLLAHSLRQMGNMLNAPSSTTSSSAHPNGDLSPTLLPITNVTSGMNAIMNTFVHILKPTDTIAYLSLTYGSTKKMFRDLSLRTKCKLQEISIPLPIRTESHLIDSILSHISPNAKLIVLDEITSNTAIHLPVHAIAKLIKKKTDNQCAVIVDGAHALFTTPVDIQKSYGVGIDYWLTNGHKWLCNAKGAGLMYIFPSAPSLRPPIISHGYDITPTGPRRGREASGFSWIGCTDPSPWFSLPSAMHIWKTLGNPSNTNVNNDNSNAGAASDGLEVYRQYACGLLEEFEEEAKGAWGLTEDDFACPKQLRHGLFMRLIPLPPYLHSKATFQHCSDLDAFALQELLHHSHAVEVPVKCLQGRLYVRVSVHIYNERRDLRRLIQVIKAMV